MFQLKNFFSSSSRDVGGSRGSTPRGEQQRKKGGREAGGARDTNGALADIDKLDITHITSRVIAPGSRLRAALLSAAARASGAQQQQPPPLLPSFVSRRPAQAPRQQRANCAAGSSDGDGGGSSTFCRRRAMHPIRALVIRRSCAHCGLVIAEQRARCPVRRVSALSLPLRGIRAGHLDHPEHGRGAGRQAQAAIRSAAARR
ncbi:hypothetical protein JKP88DRAFT_331364 [Tribonema minus]|uniref:Uncharacterized protein n=1 Tax=Tribonema minus TaxID=303371 RepID=A0A836CAF6_9STRA|nr:hypothetical protein JKP88DRAFT_331364 [Tribonema minus]